MNRIRWQCRRGMLELDVIFQRFLAQRYPQLSEEKKQLFEKLLQQDDPVLFDWLVADVVCTDVMLQQIVEDVRAT